MDQLAFPIISVSVALLAGFVIAYIWLSSRAGPGVEGTQVMLDLETLGTKPGCKVLSIGACVFDGLGSHDQLQFYVEVKRDTGQEALAEDPDTISWWTKQSPEARALLSTPEENKQTLTAALLMFNKWLRDVAGVDERGNVRVRVWGNGADFDNAVLARAYDACKVKQGWPHWGNRCYRTLKNLRPAVSLERVGTHHNALDDALSQADHCSQLLKVLRLWGR